MKLSVLIPVYNEVTTIEQIVQRVLTLRTKRRLLWWTTGVWMGRGENSVVAQTERFKL